MPICFFSSLNPNPHSGFMGENISLKNFSLSCLNVYALLLVALYRTSLCSLFSCPLIFSGGALELGSDHFRFLLTVPLFPLSYHKKRLFFNLIKLVGMVPSSTLTLAEKCSSLFRAASPFTSWTLNTTKPSISFIRIKRLSLEFAGLQKWKKRLGRKTAPLLSLTKVIKS